MSFTALWRECQDRCPVLWKSGKPASGVTLLCHNLTELLRSKHNSPRELLTIITVGVESGKFNKLLQKFRIPIVFLKKVTELRPKKNLFEDTNYENM